MTDEETLEAMIDQLGLVTVLDMMQEITSQKEDHVRENWQDEKQAFAWNKAAGILSKAATPVLSLRTFFNFLRWLG